MWPPSAGTDFSLEVLTDDFEQGMKLLADNQLHPALPEKAFTIIRQQLASTVAGQLESPDFLAGIGANGSSKFTFIYLPSSSSATLSMSILSSVK